MSNTSIKVVLHRGYIKLRFTNHRKSRYESLGLAKLAQKYWDEDKQRVKRTTKVDYKSINDVIAVHYRQAQRTQPQKPSPTSSISFLTYMEHEIRSRFPSDIGTLTKYLTIHGKLAKFLASEDRLSITPDKLRIEHIRQFDQFMQRNGMKVDYSRNNYHKVVSHFLATYKRNNYIYSFINPYDYYNFKSKGHPDKPSLIPEMVTLLTNTPIPDDPVLESARLHFLFQYYAGGMRISDLMNLRYENISNGVLSYQMIKTKKPITNSLSDELLSIIAKHLGIEPKHRPASEYLECVTHLQNIRSTRCNGLSPDVQEMISLTIFIPYATPQAFSYPILLVKALSLNDIRREVIKLKLFRENHGVITIDQRQVNFSNLYLETTKELEANYEELYSLYQNLRAAEKIAITSLLAERGTALRTKRNFVFNILESHIADIIDKGIDEATYKLMNKRSIVYNRQLKRLQKRLGISVPITSHLARTTFTNIALELQTSTNDLKAILGHTSLATTNAYISSGFPSKSKDEALRRIGSQDI